MSDSLPKTPTLVPCSHFINASTSMPHNSLRGSRSAVPSWAHLCSPINDGIVRIDEDCERSSLTRVTCKMWGVGEVRDREAGWGRDGPERDGVGHVWTRLWGSGLSQHEWEGLD